MAAAVASPTPVRAPAKGADKWVIAISVSIGALLEIIDTSIVNVAMPDLQASLGATLSQVSWVVSSYGIANVIILPLAAWLGHRFGKKRYFIFSLVGFTLASIMCGLSTSLWMLVVARILQGLTGGGLLAKAQAILFETFPREEQATAQGFFGAIVIAGPAIGPTLGGWLVTNFQWRWIFFVNVPVGILAVFLTAANLPADDPDARAKGSVDWWAILLLAVGVGSFQALLEEGNSDDWFESRLITTLAVLAVVGTVAFVHRELTTKSPVVDLRILRHRSLWAGCILGFVVGASLYGTLFAVPIFAQMILRYTSQETGMLLLPGALASAVGMILASRMIQKFDARAVLSGGALTLVGALAMLTAAINVQAGGDDLYWPMIIRSFGTVFTFLPLQLSALGPLPKEDIAGATGIFALTRQLGGSVGVALLSLLLDTRMAFHRAVLVEKLSATDPAVAERVTMLTQAMLAKGATLADAKARALTLLDGTVNQQALVLSFADTFWATGAMILVSLPLVFLLGKPPGRGATVGGGH